MYQTFNPLMRVRFPHQGKSKRYSLMVKHWSSKSALLVQVQLPSCTYNSGVECLFDKQKAVGSNPTKCIFYKKSFISLKVEYRFCKPWDVGSNPTWSIIKICRWQKGYALDCKSMGSPMEVQVLPDSIALLFYVIIINILS